MANIDKSRVANTEEIERMMEEDMVGDDNFSSRSGTKSVWSLKYRQTLNINSVMVGATKYIPSVVTSAYARAQRHSSNVNFTQGFLSNSGFIYYSVEQDLFLFQAENIREDSPGQSIKLVSNVLFFIQDIRINSKNKGLSSLQKNNKKILLFAHPWKIELYTYTVRSMAQQDNRPSIIKETTLLLEPLNIQLHLSCEKTSRFVTSLSGN